MVLLVFPELSEPVKDFREGFPFWYIHEILEGVDHPNILVVSPLREFSRINLKKEEIANWSYANRRANQIIVEYLIRQLEEHTIRLCPS